MEEVRCSMCGKEFSGDEVIKMGERLVCSECKAAFLQRLREGATLDGEVRYGGFWIRGAALALDAMIVSAAFYALSFIVNIGRGHDEARGLVVVALMQLFYWVLAIAYQTYFLGAYGATLGKMVLGLKVVRPNGDRIGYGTAFGRYWARVLSWVLIGIGYLLAAFDNEKRALHDRICDTRVIRT